MVAAGVILPSLAPGEKVGNLSGFEPAMLAASPAIEMSETAAMEPDVQVFVAEEHERNFSAEQSMPAAAVPAMKAAERILAMVPEVLPLACENQVGNLFDSGQSMPAATAHANMIAATTEDSVGGQVRVAILPLP
jgi:hypothetical protein